MNSKTGAQNLDHQDEIGVHSSTVLNKNIELFFTTPSNLNCELIIYWFHAGGRLSGGGGGGGATPVFWECKKGPH